MARVTMARRPFAGWSTGLAVASGALALLAVWILLSAGWSHAPARAIVEFDRVLVYGLVLVLAGSVAARPGDLRLCVRWAGAALIAVAVAGLASRLAPDAFPTSAGVLPERLAFPLTYWNAMGIASALSVVMALHLTASVAEPRVVRVLAAAALPAGGVALYLTFSRGAIWVLPVGILLYVVLAQPRGMATALTAIVPAIVAVKIAYGADLLARANYDTSTAAAEQGRHVALALIACAAAAALLRGLALPLDARLEAVRVAAERKRILRVAVVVGLVAPLAGLALAVDAPGRATDAWRTFHQGRYLAGSADLRQRLTSSVDNGRIDNWRVALDGFREAPLQGTGAGTYRLTWERHRPAPPMQMTDGHSLYLETLSELGVPGLVLVLVAVGSVLWGALRHLGGRERHAAAAVVAGGTMLALHAGVDWDWEMPALFAWFFGAGGIALARREGTEQLLELGRLPRVITGLAVLLLAVTPWLVASSQGPLERSAQAFARGDCRAAVDAALTVTERFGTRPEPWEILAYCDARAGAYALARRAMAAARDRDPGNWRYAYGAAVVDGMAGQDPRPASQVARRLNPLEPLARSLARSLAGARTPARWRAITSRAGIPPSA